jgi:DNA-binding transcriptional regulator YiaG
MTRRRPPPEPLTGERLRAWRELWEMSQEQLARELGCSKRALQKWEAGETRVPRYVAMAGAAVLHRLKPLE